MSLTNLMDRDTPFPWDKLLKQTTGHLKKLLVIRLYRLPFAQLRGSSSNFTLKFKRIRALLVF